jgi:putative DNA primase/helicase
MRLCCSVQQVHGRKKLCEQDDDYAKSRIRHTYSGLQDTERLYSCFQTQSAPVWPRIYWAMPKLRLPWICTSRTEWDNALQMPCWGCDQADLIAALTSRGLWGGVKGPAARQPSERRAAVERSDVALTLWHQSQPAEGTVVETYWHARGLTIPIPPTIRYLPWARHTATGLLFPVMLAVVTKAPSNRLVAVHRTFLLPDGSGTAGVADPKRSLGPIAGGAVRLAPAGSHLVVAEGIENAGSVMQATGIPAWAGLSAGGIVGLILPPLPLANEVLIGADHDGNGIGQRRACEAADRWVMEGRRVRIMTPAKPDTDYNDILRGSAPEATV